MELIEKYFPLITPFQRQQFAALEGLYEEWNARVNVISRKDMGEFEVRHVLHSLSLAKVLDGMGGVRSILDVGTGGGFPAIPLAIMFPDMQVRAVDSIGKKIRVVEAIAESLGLQNLTAVNGRAEMVDGRFDFVVSRAVAPAKTLLEWTAGRALKGWLFLKGGDLTTELAETGRDCTIYNVSDFFEEPFFETKKVVFIKK